MVTARRGDENHLAVRSSPRWQVARFFRPGHMATQCHGDLSLLDTLEAHASEMQRADTFRLPAATSRRLCASGPQLSFRSSSRPERERRAHHDGTVRNLSLCLSPEK